MILTTASRHECKYFITEQMVPVVRNYLLPFVQADRHTPSGSDPRYTVCSLYLDSPTLALYQQTARGLKNRFKLRIRTYSHDPAGPAFLEVKRRVDKVIIKSRLKVTVAEAEGYVRTHLGMPDEGRPAEGFPASEFRRLVDGINANPLMRVRYLREAHETPGSDPFRVTFDSNLHYNLSRDEGIGPSGPQWINCPLPGTILEVKFTGTFPTFVRTLIDRFHLQRLSIPKYNLCVDDARRLRLI
jgi:hypothetical protein